MLSSTTTSIRCFTFQTTNMKNLCSNSSKVTILGLSGFRRWKFNCWAFHTFIFQCYHWHFWRFEVSRKKTWKTVGRVWTESEDTVWCRVAFAYSSMLSKWDPAADIWDRKETKGDGVSRSSLSDQFDSAHITAFSQFLASRNGKYLRRCDRLPARTNWQSE